VFQRLPVAFFASDLQTQAYQQTVSQLAQTHTPAGAKLLHSGAREPRVQSPQELVAVAGNDPLQQLLAPEEFIKQFLGDKPEGFLFDEVVKEEDLHRPGGGGQGEGR